MNTLRTAVIITMSEATKPKFTAHISSGYDKTLKILPHASSRPRLGLTLAMRVLLDRGDRVNWK
jgi:hypothetical protein